VVFTQAYCLRLFLLGIFLLNFSTTSFSQKNKFAKVIALSVNNKGKKIRYYEGETIKFIDKNERFFYGEINRIGDSTFFVDEHKVYLSSISKICNTKNRQGFRFLANLFSVPAMLYFPLITTNRLINNDEPILSETGAYYSAGFIVIALVSSKIYNKRYQIAEKRPIKIIDLSP